MDHLFFIHVVLYPPPSPLAPSVADGFVDMHHLHHQPCLSYMYLPVCVYMGQMSVEESNSTPFGVAYFVFIYPIPIPEQLLPNDPPLGHVSDIGNMLAWPWQLYTMLL